MLEYIDAERAQNIGYIILIEKGTMHVCNILY